MAGRRHEPDSDNDSTDDYGSDDDDGDEARYGEWFQSVRSSTGLEVGVRVAWPSLPLSSSLGNNNGADNSNDDDDNSNNDDAAVETATTITRLELSTCLPETALAPLFHGTQWAGTRVWRAAVVALQYLLGPHHDAPSPTCCTPPPSTSTTTLTTTTTTTPNTNDNHTTDLGNNIASPPPRIDHTTTVLELGCGLGVPGMILHATRHCRCTVLTDKDDLISQLRQNLTTNFGTATGTIQAHPLDWSAAAEALPALLAAVGVPHFDVCLNCDCIYEPLYGADGWRALLACQIALLRRHPATFVLTACERRRHDGVDAYLAAARRSPAVRRVERLRFVDRTGGHVHQHDAPPREVIELYRLHGHEDPHEEQEPVLEH